MSAESMWDEDDGFFYDLLRLPDGGATRMRVRSMVGLLPLAAATVFDPRLTDRHPELLDEVRAFIARHPSVGSTLTPGRFHGERGHHVLALFDEDRLRRLLPAGESDTAMFGGNSNWRGPVWFPMNALVIRALLNLYVGYGDGFTVACPTGSGRELRRAVRVRRGPALARPRHVLRVFSR